MEYYDMSGRQPVITDKQQLKCHMDAQSRSTFSWAV